MRTPFGLFKAMVFSGLDMFGNRYIDRLESQVKSRFGPVRPKMIKRAKFTITEHRTPRSKPVIRRMSRETMTALRAGKIKWSGAKWEVWYKGELVGYAHYDLTIKGTGHRWTRWAIPGGAKQGPLGIFPGNGEKSTCIEQPLHMRENPEMIWSGYGAGYSRIIRSGRALTVGKPGHFLLEGIPGEYIVHNNLLMRAKGQDFSAFQGMEKTKMNAELFFVDQEPQIMEILAGKSQKYGQILSSELKKDGTHTFLSLQSDGKRLSNVQIASYRENKRTGEERIGYNCKLMDNYNELEGRRTSLAPGEYVMRVEAWSRLGLERVTNHLQADPVKAAHVGGRIELYLHGIESFAGRKPADRLDFYQMSRQIYEGTGGRIKEIPRAITSKGRLNLVSKARREWEQGMVDGVVIYTDNKTIKAKFHREEDGQIIGYQVRLDGLVEPVIQIPSGDIVGTTDISRQNRIWLTNHPDEAIGLDVKVLFTKKTSKGVPFQPLGRLDEEILSQIIASEGLVDLSPKSVSGTSEV